MRAPGAQHLTDHSASKAFGVAPDAPAVDDVVEPQVFNGPAGLSGSLRQRMRRPLAATVLVRL